MSIMLSIDDIDFDEVFEFVSKHLPKQCKTIGNMLNYKL